MDNLGRDMGNMIGCMMMALVVSVPLGIWKAVEIVWWLVTHIHIK